MVEKDRSGWINDMKRHAVWIGAAISLAVISYVLVTLDWSEVRTTIALLKWAWVLLAFAIYFVNYLLRAYRFKILLDLNDISYLKILGVTNLYGMYLYLLPAKFGELTFPVLVKNRLDVEISTSTGTLIVARVFDFLTIAIILPIAMLIYWEIIPINFKIASLVFCLLVFGGFAFFYWLLRNPDLILPRLVINKDSKPITQKFLGFLDGVYRAAQTIERNQVYWMLFIVTLGLWICINLNFYLITLALGYQFFFFQIVVVSIIMIPVTLFPIQGFANLGAHELGWVTALTLFGLPYLEALNLAVSSHVIYIFFVLILGGIGLTLLTILRRPMKLS